MKREEAKGRAPKTPNLQDMQKKRGLQRSLKMRRKKRATGLSQVPRGKGTSGGPSAGLDHMMPTEHGRGTQTCVKILPG